MPASVSAAVVRSSIVCRLSLARTLSVNPISRVVLRFLPPTSRMLSLQTCRAFCQKPGDVVRVLCTGYMTSLHQPLNDVTVLHVLEIDIGKISKYKNYLLSSTIIPRNALSWAQVDHDENGIISKYAAISAEKNRFWYIQDMPRSLAIMTRKSQIPLR